jgi:MoaA/NifB/PqqE/SkfB family radical SAM enzyme
VVDSGGQLKRVFDAIDFAKKEDLNVMISTLPHRKSYLEIPEIIQFCKDKKIDEFRMQPLMPLGRGDTNYDDLRIDDSQYNLLKKLLTKENSDILKTEWGDPVDHFFMLQEVSYSPSITINAYGNILISPYLPFSIWDLNLRTFNEFISEKMPEKALKNQTVLKAISSIISVNDMLGVNETIKEITKINERETISLENEILMEV